MKKMKQLFATLAMLIICTNNLYAQVPTISGISTTSGPVGTLITIDGTNLGSPTSLKVGGSTMVIVSKSSTKLVGFVMPNSNSGTIAVTNASGTAVSSSSFKVVGYAPPNGANAVLDNTSFTTTSGQGNSVAMSADGNTVAVGSNKINNYKGAVTIYTWDGSSWSVQASLLTAATGVSGDNTGISLALSADGNTLLAGAVGLDNLIGGAFVFTRSGTTWSQQGGKLQGTGYIINNTFVYQGQSVALSADGNTALIGGYMDNFNKGAVWVFTRSGTTWSQQAKLVASNPGGSHSYMGYSVSISADGNTALFGAQGDETSTTYEGAGYVFTRSGTTWTQQAKLIASNASSSSQMGTSVSLSADGNTAVLGAPGDNSRIGAFWVFTRSGSSWTQQGNKYIGSGAVNGSFNSAQGTSVAISADGNTILEGANQDNNANGSIWVFRRSSTTWTQQGSKISYGTNIGVNLSISADGTKAVSGAPNFTNTPGGYAIILGSNGNNMADLDDLTMDNQNLTPLYSAGVLSYTTTLTNASNVITATAPNAGTIRAKINGGAYTSINNGSPSTLNLNLGTNTINVEVTSADNTAKKVYTITATKVSADLSGISLSSGTLSPVFASGTTNYNAPVAVNSITVTPTLADAAASMQVRVNGGTYVTVSNNTASSSLALNFGINPIDIKVTAADGTTVKTYTINAAFGSSNADLSAMSVTNATISPVFSSATVTYSASVSNATTSTTITPTSSDANATMQISYNGGSYSNTTSGTSVGPMALNVGSNTINIKVNAQNGLTVKTYNTTIIRAASSNNNLSNMSISTGTLSPVFATATTTYSTTLASSISSLTLTATKQDTTSNIKVRINGGSYSTVVNGAVSTALPLNIGSNTINVLVTAENASTKTYTITVVRLSNNANLSALTANTGSLSPAFTQATTTYTAPAIATAATSVSVTPTRADANATLKIRVNGGAYTTATSGSTANLALTQGANAIEILVTAQDTAVTKTYTLTIVRTCGSLVTPSVSISTAVTTICSADATSFNATGVNSGSSPVYQWVKNGANVGTGSTITFLGTIAHKDSIWCVLTANNACQTTATVTSNKIKMTVNTSPSIGAVKNNIGVNIASLSLCSSGGSSTLYNNFPSGIWSSSNPSVATAVNGVSASGGVSNSGLVTAVSNGTAAVYYTITSANGCSAVASTIVYVDVVPALNATIVSSPVCINDSIALVNSSTIPSGGTGVWTSINARTSVNAATGVVTGVAAGPASIKYTITTQYGCTNSTTVGVVVNSLPNVPSINYAAGTVNPQTGAGGGFCNNRTFTVVGSPTGGMWSTTGGITVNNITGAASTSSILGAGSLTYTYTDANGCSNSRIIAGNIVVCVAPRGVNGVTNEKRETRNEFTMYPNPAKTFISLSVNTLIGAGSIVVTDLFGKYVKTQSLSIGNNTVDIANLAKGIYFVSMITSEGKTTKKLVVE